MKKLYNRLPRFIRNKYFISSFIFILIIGFFDNYNLVFLTSVRKELSNVKNEVAYLEVEIKASRASVDELTTNPKSLEKFARENYFMKKPNEEIFVIVEE